MGQLQVKIILIYMKEQGEHCHSYKMTFSRTLNVSHQTIRNRLNEGGLSQHTFESSFYQFGLVILYMH